MDQNLIFPDSGRNPNHHRILLRPHKCIGLFAFEISIFVNINTIDRRKYKLMRSGIFRNHFCSPFQKKRIPIPFFQVIFDPIKVISQRRFLSYFDFPDLIPGLKNNEKTEVFSAAVFFQENLQRLRLRPVDLNPLSLQKLSRRPVPTRDRI